MTETRRFAFTSESMIAPADRNWWQRLRDRLLRRPDPRPIQPPGTVPLRIEITTNGRMNSTTFFAARITEGQ